MDIKPLELKRETIFKDAVLSQAEASSMEVIAAAGRQRAEALEAAYAQCEAADPDMIAGRLAKEAERSYAAISGEAHRELLAWREGLVTELFTEVEARLAKFTASSAYEPWLLSKLAAHEDFTKGGEGITLQLREEDASFAPVLQKALSDAAIEYAADIRLGGVRIAGKRVLYDESLGSALQEQLQAFYESGELRL